MTDLSAIHEEKQSAPSALCWICNCNEANSGEHKTKRSDLAASLACIGDGRQSGTSGSPSILWQRTCRLAL
jgi:hypothetical protein